ncbi:MAG: tRNA (N6-threonylcarbamoyladenosine(37)-N6)-methyltransferase TrmO [Roseinatronobacter sp.]
MTRFNLRDGETRLDAPLTPDATITFIGHIESPWSLDNCPKNLRAARETGQGAVLHVAAPFRPGLEGIAPGDTLIALYWMTQAPRDLIRQVPRHRTEGAGTFALRSPARPNPIGLGVVKVRALDMQAGRITVDAIDAVNGTPLIDLKPFMPLADRVPD